VKLCRNSICKKGERAILAEAVGVGAVATGPSPTTRPADGSLAGRCTGAHLGSVRRA